MPSNNHDQLILAVDAGTQSIRAALIDPAGNIIDLVKTPIQPYFSNQPGWAEQEPDYYWDNFGKTTRQLLERNPKLRDALTAAAVTTQRGTYINVDQNGKALRPAIVWLDNRKADTKPIINSALVPIIKAVGMWDFLQFAVQYCRSNWIQQNQPEIWEKTHKWLALSGFFTHRLTGEFIDSSGGIIGTIPFDVKKHDWAGKRDLKWRLFPMEADKLPRLVQPTEPLGEITAAAAQHTGIPQGLPLIAASNDKACDIIGAGCLTPETACLSLGTTATINTQNSKYVELRFMMPPFPSAIPGEFYSEVSLMRGMWMVTWFKEEFGLAERLEAQEKQVAAEQLFDKLIEGVPPGSMGLVLQPYWMAGPELSAAAKGSIIGFGDVHTRAHLYRAIIEGLVFGLKEGALLTEKKNKVPITSVRASGGGSQSDAILQITADVFGLPVSRPHTPETSALGAAMDAAVGLKLHPDFPAAVKAMTRVARTFEPIPPNQALYQDLYEKVYKKIYRRLLPLFLEIQRITGYPG